MEHGLTNFCRWCGATKPYDQINFAVINMNGVVNRELVCTICREKYATKRQRAVGKSYNVASRRSVGRT